MGDAHVVTVDGHGSFVIPQELRARHCLSTGSALVLIKDDHGFVILTRKQAVARVWSSVAGGNLVNALLGDRRQAGALEDED